MAACLFEWETECVDACVIRYVHACMHAYVRACMLVSTCLAGCEQAVILMGLPILEIRQNVGMRACLGACILECPPALLYACMHNVTLVERL